MSKPVQILAGVAGLGLVAAVALTMFGKLDLPLGPLNGMLAKDDAAVTDAAALDSGVGATGAVECDPALSTGTTDPLADPAAGGAVTDPAAGGAAADPAAVIDPAAGAPVAAGSDGWDGSPRVTAASAGAYDAGSVGDSYVLAADAVTDPGVVDPAAGGAVTDPAAGAGADPAAGAIDPSAGTGDPAATGVADPLADPCADTGVAGVDAGAGADPTLGGTGADPSFDPGAGAGAGAGATGGAGAGGSGGGAGGRSTTDGTNTGNSPEALRAAKDATSVMQKAKITVTTTATLVPSAGGVAKGAALRKYRAGVTAAVLVMKLDESAQSQWTSASRAIRTELVKSFITRLGKSYRKASRSVTVVDPSGTVLAVGDAAAGGKPTVKIY